MKVLTTRLLKSVILSGAIGGICGWLFGVWGFAISIPLAAIIGWNGDKL